MRSPLIFSNYFLVSWKSNSRSDGYLMKFYIIIKSWNKLVCLKVHVPLNFIWILKLALFCIYFQRANLWNWFLGTYFSEPRPMRRALEGWGGRIRGEGMKDKWNQRKYWIVCDSICICKKTWQSEAKRPWMLTLVMK